LFTSADPLLLLWLESESFFWKRIFIIGGGEKQRQLWFGGRFQSNARRGAFHLRPDRYFGFSLLRILLAIPRSDSQTGNEA
jgi:hypothetical protein